jgi:hypothetical protein
MGKIDDPKISKPIIRDPEHAGTPIERKRHPQSDGGLQGKVNTRRGQNPTRAKPKCGSKGVDKWARFQLGNF